jgi:uncharacterized protein YyaL (SSP411 family)
VRAAGFVRAHLWRDGDEVLLRRYRDGDAAFNGYAEDYASLAFGVLELFQADGDPAWLAWADTLQRRMDERFWDAEGAGWFSTTNEDPSVLIRLKEDYDGAEPSAGALAALNLITLTHLVPDDERRARLEQALGRYGSKLGAVARAVPLVASAVSALLAGTGQVVIVGEEADAARRALVAETASRYRPFAVTVLVTDAHRAALSARMPFIASLPARDGRPTAYVCRDFVCEAPASSPEALGRALDAPHAQQEV